MQQQESEYESDRPNLEGESLLGIDAVDALDLLPRDASLHWDQALTQLAGAERLLRRAEQAGRSSDVLDFRVIVDYWRFRLDQLSSQRSFAELRR